MPSPLAKRIVEKWLPSQEDHDRHGTILNLRANLAQLIDIELEQVRRAAYLAENVLVSEANESEWLSDHEGFDAIAKLTAVLESLKQPE